MREQILAGILIHPLLAEAILDDEPFELCGAKLECDGPHRDEIHAPVALPLRRHAESCFANEARIFAICKVKDDHFALFGRLRSDHLHLRQEEFGVSQVLDHNETAF